MSFIFHKTEINGVLKIETHQFLDDRGVYNKVFDKSVLEKNGVICDFTETSDIFSVKGSLRGLHYQTNYSQAKLLHVIDGIIFDVALDLRNWSETYGKYHCELLDANDKTSIFIPEGFAHGFMTLSDVAIFSYQCSGKYDPDSCGGIIWNDKDLAIPWPLAEFGIKNVILSDKDGKLQTFSDYCKIHGDMND